MTAGGEPNRKTEPSHVHAVVRLGIGEVQVTSGRRRLNLDTVSSLAESIKQIGLKTPIAVRRVGENAVLVAGYHRLEAAKSLGLAEIDCTYIEGGETEARLLIPAAKIERVLAAHELCGSRWCGRLLTFGIFRNRGAARWRCGFSAGAGTTARVIRVARARRRGPPHLELSHSRLDARDQPTQTLVADRTIVLVREKHDGDGGIRTQKRLALGE